jgi:hypothetical protein
MRFDTTDPEAAQWAKARAAAMIVEVTEVTRTAVRELISNMFISQVDIDSAASLIRASVGLSSGQVKSLLKFRKDVKPGALVTIGKRTYRVPKVVTSEAMERLVAKKSERLLRDRAFTIAATEAMTASNEGMRLFWEQGRKRGTIPATQKRVWITTPDEKLCPVCGPMEGVMVGLKELFTLPTGERVMNPPAHPRCRCTQGLAA